LAERELERHRHRLEDRLLDVDEAMRAMAASGMPFEEDATTRSLRRSEAMLRRVRDKARAEVLRVRAQASALAGSTSPTPTPAPGERPVMNGAAQESQIQKLRAGFATTAILENPDVVPPLVATPGILPPRPVPADAGAGQPPSPEERERRDRRRRRQREKQA